MKITVTKADIAGARASTDPKIAYERSCPVARSLTRMGFSVDVCTHHVKFNPGGAEIVMPQKAIAWIRRYDGGERVNPFAFEMDRP